MPKYDPTRPSQGPAAPRPFPGDHLKRAGKGQRRAEPPPETAGNQPADEPERTPQDVVVDKTDRPPGD